MFHLVTQHCLLYRKLRVGNGRIRWFNLEKWVPLLMTEHRDSGRVVHVQMTCLMGKWLWWHWLTGKRGCSPHNAWKESSIRWAYIPSIVYTFTATKMVVLLGIGDRNLSDLGLVHLIFLGGDVYIVVTKREELAFHPVNWSQTVKLEIIDEIDVVPDDVLPKLRGEKDCSKDERAPIEVPDFDLTLYHYLLEVNEADDDALCCQLHLVHNFAHESHHVLRLRMLWLIW